MASGASSRTQPGASPIALWPPASSPLIGPTRRACPSVGPAGPASLASVPSSPRAPPTIADSLRLIARSRSTNPAAAWSRLLELLVHLEHDSFRQRSGRGEKESVPKASCYRRGDREGHTLLHRAVAEIVKSHVHVNCDWP